MNKIRQPADVMCFVILFCVQQNEIKELVDLFLQSFFDILFFLSNSLLVIVVVVVGTNLNWSNGHVLRSESERWG